MPTEDPVSDTVGTVPESTDVTGESESGTVGLGTKPEAPLSKDGVRVSTLGDGLVTTAPLLDAVGTVPESTDVTGGSESGTVGLGTTPEAPLSKDGVRVSILDDGSVTTAPLSDAVGTVPESTDVPGESALETVGLEPLPSEDGDGIAVPGDD